MHETRRGPRWEHWQSDGWNTRSHQQYNFTDSYGIALLSSCYTVHHGKDSYGCPPLHLEARVWQHERCTKAKKQAQVCDAWQRKWHEHVVATRSVSTNLNLQQGRSLDLWKKQQQMSSVEASMVRSILFLSHRIFHDCPCEQDSYTYRRTTRHQLQYSPV